MNLTTTRPQTLEMAVALDPDDRCYDLCTGATFHFDCGNWILTVAGDAGYYSYQWSPEDDRTFFELLAGASNEYLLRKLGTQVFSLEESIHQTLARLESVFTESQEPDIYKQIRALEMVSSSEETFYYCTQAFLTGSQFYQDQENRLIVAADPDCFICPAKVYPPNVVAIVNIFDQYIRPKLNDFLGESI